ncbi:reverse transcriptase domain-containing protein [Streptomyces phaeochromogenes]|uniref:reverse transcriptase domain-containing protein n=1 Tax=Streptomyces phaeochromogenes TaxID=1923 RepID=UPI003F4D0A10
MVQASLKAVLEPIFEADFMPCSYGFRPNRRAHDAIAEIHHLSSGANKYHWVLEADIKACFDEIDHTALMNRLRARIKDKRVCTLVKAFLKSGVMTTSGDREETLTGTPQGGILSPLLANIALSALDEHFARQWQQEMGSYKRRVTRRKQEAGSRKQEAGSRKQEAGTGQLAADPIRPAQGRGRAAGQPQPHLARVGKLLPARGVEGGIQHGR